MTNDGVDSAKSHIKRSPIRLLATLRFAVVLCLIGTLVGWVANLVMAPHRKSSATTLAEVGFACAAVCLLLSSIWIVRARRGDSVPRFIFTLLTVAVILSLLAIIGSIAGW